MRRIRALATLATVTLMGVTWQFAPGSGQQFWMDYILGPFGILL